MFQSTRPRGARRFDKVMRYLVISVSIHAPTWGATTWHNWDQFITQMFQSTRPRGARLAVLTRITKLRCFNPRAHVGRDLRSWVENHSGRSFNPRAHVGRDPARVRGWPLSSVSIHAPTWGATSRVQDITAEVLFQSTRPRGARQNSLAEWGKGKSFQSTRPRGARHSSC